MEEWQPLPLRSQHLLVKGWEETFAHRAKTIETDIIIPSAKPGLHCSNMDNVLVICTLIGWPVSGGKYALQIAFFYKSCGMPVGRRDADADAFPQAVCLTMQHCPRMVSSGTTEEEILRLNGVSFDVSIYFFFFFPKIVFFSNTLSSETNAENESEREWVSNCFFVLEKVGKKKKISMPWISWQQLW